MKIAVIGAGGQLAHDLRLALAHHELFCLVRSDVDLCQPEMIETRLGSLALDLVINTAAYNLVDKAETEPAAAFETNAVGTGYLARHCGHLGIPLVHFSTDYVFGADASRATPWEVTDAPGPVSVYGNSKLAGEHAVRMYADEHLVIRTCGLYGRMGSRGKGGNFVETMLRLADGGKPVRVVNDQRCTPSYTADVAAITARLVDAGARGTVHVTNAGECSWFELATEIFRQSGKLVDCQPITSAEFGAAARRPSYSVLSLRGLAAFGITSPTWQDALGRYLAARQERGA